MPLGKLTQVGPKNHVLDRFQIPTLRGHFDGEKGACSGHAWPCSAIDVLKATQRGAEPVRCGCRLGRTRRGHIGETRRRRLNRPCAAAMRPYVKLLWPLVITAGRVDSVTGVVVVMVHVTGARHGSVRSWRWSMRCVVRTAYSSSSSTSSSCPASYKVRQLQ